MDSSIGLLLVQICRAHRHLVDVALNRIGVHVGQEHMVYRLAIQEGIAQTQLAQALCIDTSTATKICSAWNGMQRTPVEEPTITDAGDLGRRRGQRSTR